MRFLLIASLAAGLLVSPLAARASVNDEPKAVVQSTVEAIIKVLQQREKKDRLTERNRDDIRKVVTGRFDYGEMARRSLGKSWNDMDLPRQKRFTDLFRELLERSYGNRLASYKNQKVTYSDAETKGDKARVATMVDDGQVQTPVDYTLWKSPTGWQVYDIKIEGVSLISTFREDFKASLEKSGIDGLMSEVEAKVKKLKAGE